MGDIDSLLRSQKAKTTIADNKKAGSSSLYLCPGGRNVHGVIYSYTAVVYVFVPPFCGSGVIMACIQVISMM